MNNAGGLKKNLLMVSERQQDVDLPTGRRVRQLPGSLAHQPVLHGIEDGSGHVRLNKVPLFGDPAERVLAQFKEAVKAGLHGGMLFEDLGFRYIGPIDGHNLAILRKYLRMVKDLTGPVLLHVVTEKGHGFQPAEADPVFFHTPPAFEQDGDKAVPKSRGSAPGLHRIACEGCHCRPDAAGFQGDGTDGRHVPGQQTGAGAR